MEGKGIQESLVFRDEGVLINRGALLPCFSFLMQFKEAAYYGNENTTKYLWREQESV